MALSPENKIVNGLWVGSHLSSMELLTLHSFLHHGHEFHLWLYEPVDVVLPVNVKIRDANEIIPANKIFRKKNNDHDFKIGKGSIGSPFSDLFRYKLLYENGGWWVDMDVTCLKPFNVTEPYFFRGHPLLPMIGNIIKVPARSELMQRVFHQVNEECNEDTLEWLLPNKILNKHIADLDLSRYINSNLSAQDWWEDVEVFIKSNKRFPQTWLFIHWMNEEWRSREMSKKVIFTETAIGTLCEQYGIQTKPYPVMDKLLSKFIYSFR